MEHGAGGHGPLRLTVATAAVSTGSRPPVSQWRRGTEWGLLTVVILALVAMFLTEGRRVQGQAELAAVKSTLGAMRTAAVLQDLQARAAGRMPGVQPGANPFELLQTLPGNYLGVLRGVQVVSGRPGSWFYDRDCDCVGYIALEPRWLESPAGDGVLRFRVRRGTGPLQLDALAPYRWQGRPVD